MREKVKFAIGIAALIVIVGIIRLRNRPYIDKYGNMRCKACNYTGFHCRKNAIGMRIYKCDRCGKIWIRL